MNWLVFALMTVLSWGVYGVLLHKGRGNMPMGPEAQHASLKAFLFVCIAYALIGLATAALLCFSLASNEFIQRTVGMPADDLKWTQGAVAFLAFCLSLIDLTWNPAIKSKAHDQAVAHYQRMNYEIRNLLGSGPVTRERVRWLEEEFLDVAELPRIPENQSLVLKRHHLQKIAISKALELNPHQAIWWLTFKLWWRGPVRPVPKPIPSPPITAPQ